MVSKMAIQVRKNHHWCK